MWKLKTITVGFVASFALATILFQPVQAQNFNPGRIIDDEVFYDAGAMGSAAEVQRFIRQHTPACDTWGRGPSGYGNLTRAEYAVKIKGWHGPPYACLQDYHENPQTGENSFSRGGGAFSGGISAGQIIWDAAQKYSINPQVLLVLLRKESAGPLFADAWPLQSQYRYAMGYGCPDSGPNYSANCQSSKSGFYKQVNLAAWQLRKYRNEIKNYNYQPGRINRILYNPNPACGYKDVYIENYATASLYIYTPYTPNDAALAAYPGTAPCGAYGNRNFFFMFREWFGSTSINSTLLRSHNNATVYLVSDKIKYPIASYEILGALSPLGGVGFVSQSYLDKIPTGRTAGRLMRSPDGTVYFHDSGIRLAFTSCAMVEHYGMSCGDVMNLTEAQINRFYHGPRMINGYKTTSGKHFYIQNGTRREVLDKTSLAQQNYDQGYNVLSETAIRYLPYGNPVVRDAAMIENRASRSKQLFSGGYIHNIKHSEYVDRALSSLGGDVLDPESIAKLPKSNQTIDDYITSSTGESYIITSEGKKKVINQNDIPVKAAVLSDNTIRNIPGSGSVESPVVIRSADNGTVYVLESRKKRPIVAMDDVYTITGTNQPYIAWVSGQTLSKIPTGNVVVAASKLVKAPSNGTVYVSDGYDTLLPLSSFSQASDIGVKGHIRSVPDEVISKYKVSSRVLSPYVSCSGETYLGIGGVLYRITLPGQNPYPLQDITCRVLNKSINLPDFISSPDGTIFQVRNNTIYPIRSWQTFVNLNQQNKPVIPVSYNTVQFLPKGSAL